MSVKEVAQYGIPFRSIISNGSCIFGMSSGVAGLNPTTKIRAKVRKTKPLILNYDGMPAGARQYFEGGKGKEHGKQILQEQIGAKLQEAIDLGHLYLPGEEIVGFHADGLIDKIFLTNSGDNQPARVVGFKQLGKPSNKGFGVFKTETLKINVQVELDVADYWWKLRNDGIKCTTTPIDLKFFDLNGQPINIQWDLFLLMECIKGRLASLISYVFAQGGGAVDVKSGLLHLDNGQDINLLKAKNEVYDWLKQTVQTVWVEFPMARAEYDIMLKARGDHEDLIVQDDSNPNYVLLREKIQILEGEMVAEVEISTPRENCGPSQMTLEMLASLALQNQGAAESINSASRSYREGVKGVVDMITNKPEEVYTLDLTTASARNELQVKIGNIQSLEGKQIIARYKEVFPQGLLIQGTSSSTGRKTNMYLNFDTVGSMSTFIGGVGEGIAADIVAFLSYINNPGEGNADSKIYSKICALKSSMEGWLFTNLESKNIMKRMARTYKGAAIGLKIRTAPWAILNHKEGQLPKVALNPADDVLKLLAKAPTGGYIADYCELVEKSDPRASVKTSSELSNELARSLGQKWVFNPEKMNGTIIGVGRTPMPMITGCQLVLSEEVGIAHAVILPHVWAMSNEGDSDGDGVILLNLFSHGVSVEAALQMNTHPMGMLGYKIAYGPDPSNWPCAEFVGYCEKWGKKAIVWEDEKLEEKYLTPYILGQTLETYEKNARLVAAHYRGPVGVSYNICVVLTHQATNLFYGIQAAKQGNLKTKDEIVQLENRLTLLQMSMAVAWRLLYEGLGLAGYTPQAKEFFTLLQVATYQDSYTYKASEDGWEGIEPSWTNQKTKESDKRNCKSDLVYLGNHRDGLDFSNPSGGISHLGNVAKAIVGEIVKANRIAQDAGAVYRGSARVANMTGISKLNAKLYMGLRQIGQGRDPVGQKVLDLEQLDMDMGEEAVMAESLINSCFQEKVWTNHASEWIQEVMAMSCEVHMKANSLLHVRNNVEVEI